MSFQAPLFRPKYITLNHSSGRCSRLAPFSRIILHTRGYSTVLHHRLNPRSSRQQPAPLFRLPFTSPSIIYQNNPRANMSSEKTSGPEGNKLFTRDHLFDLSGKVALVTGGGTGIGLMATQALAGNGAKVYITGRDKSKLDNVVNTYNQNISGEIIGIPADVTDKEDVARLASELESREPCLCILVNNAGLSSETFETEAQSAQEMKNKLFDEKSANLDDWLNVHRTNVAGLYLVSVAFLPLLQRSTERHPGWSGTIVNITSISGMVKTAQHHFAYNASKAAAIHINRMLAAELASNHIPIRVNSIAPGVFPSEMTAGESDQTQKSGLPKEKYEGKVPAGRPGQDEDMASAVLFMVCNQYVNGQNVAVDGGYTLAAGL